MMPEEAIIWKWNPLISIGEIIFGEPIEPLIIKYDLIELPKPFDEAYWDSYEVPDFSKRIYSEDGIVTIVGCFDNLYYGENNLFGLTFGEIRGLLGEEDKVGETVTFDFEDDDFEEIPIEYYKLGLQLWFRDGIVESAMLSGTSESQ
jgi:hypothetical protein